MVRDGMLTQPHAHGGIHAMGHMSNALQGPHAASVHLEAQLGSLAICGHCLAAGRTLAGRGNICALCACRRFACTHVSAAEKCLFVSCSLRPLTGLEVEAAPAAAAAPAAVPAIAKRPAVLADGTYATQSAVEVTPAVAAISALNTPSLRSLLLVSGVAQCATTARPLLTDALALYVTRCRTTAW